MNAQPQAAKNIGGLNMRRALLIARRDYLGYIKTWGFWITFFLPLIGGILGFLLVQLDLDFETTRYETILDDTGQHKAAITAQYEQDYTARARKSTQVTAQGMQSLTKRYFRDQSKAAYLNSGGLSAQGLADSLDDAVVLETYDPTKAAGTAGEGQKVTEKDKIPYLVAGAMAAILWLTVFSGAYMLLTSMLEEKLNKLLEMMLATTNFGEIILGKLIGVAALTLTTMLPYIVLGGGGLIALILFGPAELSGPIREAFTWKMLVFFPTFLILGYIFYGCLFIAMGALAESMQDAQTITTPIVMVLTVCVLIVPMGWNNPDSPILVFASWFPLSAPFAAITRLPSDPPAWELFLSAGFLALLSVGVIILASRVFRYGVLSGAGVKGISSWFKRTVLRRKNA